MSSSTSTSPTPSPTETGSGGSAGGGPNSPLLFFVALGFGVVFTNLWIIVGVKYCFRYNQRNRARLAGEDPDGVDLAAMPQRRRRREKKLMTIDEVNDKFPLIKYKTWRANRADQGLPTSGGLAKDAAETANVTHLSNDDQSPVISEKAEDSSKSPIVSESEKPDPTQKTNLQQSLTEFYGSQPNLVTSAGTAVTAPEPTVTRRSSQQIDDDDVDQIRMAIPAEQLADMGGDTCAICIDTIEEEDDIRGLTCGHAFHASCVDPWLTSRRACCPLCKADYYIPKPRPEGAQSETRRTETNPTPFSIMAGGRPGNRRGRPRMIFPGVFISPTSENRTGAGQSSRRQTELQSEPTISSTAPEISQQEQSGWRQRIRLPNLPALSRIRTGRGNEAGSQPTEANPTPAQLEAGTR